MGNKDKLLLDAEAQEKTGVLRVEDNQTSCQEARPILSKPQLQRKTQRKADQ